MSMLKDFRDFAVKGNVIDLAVAVIIANTVLQQVEGHIIRPRIMENSVGLHPLIIVFAFLVGGKFFGIIGMFFAIPVAGIIRVLMKYNLKELISDL
jgi:predicted PurR-regulated permease PerM